MWRHHTENVTPQKSHYGYDTIVFSPWLSHDDYCDCHPVNVTQAPWLTCYGHYTANFTHRHTMNVTPLWPTWAMSYIPASADYKNNIYDWLYLLSLSGPGTAMWHKIVNTPSYILFSEIWWRRDVSASFIYKSSLRNNPYIPLTEVFVVHIPLLFIFFARWNFILWMAGNAGRAQAWIRRDTAFPLYFKQNCAS